jgi:hypothetical protein
MKIQSLIRSPLLLCAAFLLFGPGLVSAQQLEEIELGREEVQLRVDISDAIERDTDVVNTALVFNNSGRVETVVHCTAYAGNGDVLGRGRTRVPARGVKYLRASDLSDGVDFVGSAVCKARGRVTATAVFLAPGAITDLNVKQNKRRRSTRMRFPLIASY